MTYLAATLRWLAGTKGQKGPPMGWFFRSTERDFCLPKKR